MEKQPLYIKVHTALLTAIKNMKPDKNKLPSEKYLVERFKVSRSTLRTALNTLILNKMVVRTKDGEIYAFPSVSKLSYRMDHYKELRELLSANGTVSTLSSKPVLTAPSTEMLHRMPEAAEQTVYSWAIRYMLDGKLVVYALFEMPEKFFIKEPPEEYHTSFKEYMKEYLSPDITYHISWIKSDIRPDLAELFQSQKQVVETWEQVFKDIHDTSICFCRLSFHPEDMDLSIVVSL
jgi:DNA-binding GntR family transcriptional regulator